MSVYWGVNLSHNASICQLKNNGKIDWFAEEERYSRKKHDSYPLSIISNLNFTDKIKHISISSLYENWDIEGFKNNASYLIGSIKKFLYKHNKNNLIEYATYNDHHLFHAACGFYNSGFKDSAVLVVDGCGNYIDSEFHEVESIFTFSYPNLFTKHHTNVCPSYMCSSNYEGKNQEYPIGIGMIYSAISEYLGFGSLEPGKVMGLSAYGKEDDNIKPFIVDNKLDHTQFYRIRHGLKFIPYDYVDIKSNLKDKYHKNLQPLYNLAYRIQKDFEIYMIKLIKFTLSKTNQKNLVLTGGCALNCVANYKYLDILPKDVNLYIDPISSDAGTSIGLAKLSYYSNTQSMEINPLKSLYLGVEK
jgi:carbamoyltransferase